MTRSDALLICRMAHAQAYEALNTAAQYLKAIDPAITYTGERQLFNVCSSFVVGQNAAMTIFSFTGTDNVQQWVSHVLGSPLQPLGPGVGEINAYFAANALVNWQRLKGYLPGASQRVVFIGHSLGAALAEILATNAILNGWTNVGLYKVAGPKVGNSDWINQWAGFGADYGHLVNTLDIVPSLPPTSAIPWVAFWPWLLGQAFFSYAPIPACFTQDQYGKWSNGTLPNMTNDRMVSLIPFATANHISAGYAARIMQRWGTPSDLRRGAFGYLEPCRLLDQTQQGDACNAANPIDPPPDPNTLPPLPKELLAANCSVASCGDTVSTGGAVS